MTSRSNKHNRCWTSSAGFATIPGGVPPNGKSSVASVAAAEPLTVLPAAPYPAIRTEADPVPADATGVFRGNRYSVPPELVSAQVTVTRVLGSEVSTSSPRRRSR
ncbi:Mu transposase domain-containing protein [Rhodococcus sp. T7]|uniref:Mu transposase domain-containing protein n=1 Tax=Rhodococcus sp. T7 TaxID=627444 RepID=UPI003FA6932B